MSRRQHSYLFINGLDRTNRVAVYHRCGPPSRVTRAPSFSGRPHGPPPVPGRPVEVTVSPTVLRAFWRASKTPKLIEAKRLPFMSFSLADSAVLSLIIYLVVDLIYFALDPRTRG